MTTNAFDPHDPEGQFRANPAPPLPGRPPLESPGTKSPPKNLRNLVHSGAEYQLSRAKGWLIFIGIVTILFNLYLIVQLPDEIAQESLRGNVEPDLEPLMYLFGFLIYGGTVLLGVAFIVLGMMIKKHPLPVAITSLALFLGSQLIFAAINPASLVSGFIIKCIVLFVLIKAVGSAAAYRKEQRLVEEFQP